MNYHSTMEQEYSVVLDNAYNLHIQGKLSEAKELYEKLLEIDGSNPETLNLYAQLNVSLKNYEKAEELFSVLYSLTGLDDVKINLLKVRAHIAMTKNDYPLAVNLYSELEDFFPDDIDILMKLAYFYDVLKDRQNAIKYLSKISDKVENPDILYRLGVLYKKEENYHKAVECFDRVLQITPDNKDAMLNIASSYKFIDKENALSIYREIEQIYPDDLNIKFFIYKLYIDMLDFEGALNTVLELLKVNSENALYLTMAADAYLELYNYEKAIEYYTLAVKYNPDDVGAKCSLAYAYSCHRDTDKAVEILENMERNTAVIQDLTILHLRKRNFDKVKDDYFNWHTELKTTRDAEEKARQYFYKLKVGEKFNISEEEFTQFRINLSSDTFNKITEYQKKLLRNQDFQGKKVLVYSGHGAGDFIMFSRYLNILKNQASHVIVSVDNALAGIFRYSFPDVEVVPSSEYINPDRYDFAIPEMCLIYCLKKDLKLIPFPNKYLDIPEEKIIEKSKLDILNTDKRKIGIFWQGNPTTLANRSVKLKYFVPLIEMSDCQYYSFQISKVDFESHDLKGKLPLIDLSSHISDYTDTAALLKNMDLLITIDTSIAHLAGAMGIKTYLLLPYDAEWRWFYDEKKTDWYDSIEIFKQPKPNDWTQVIDRVKNELQTINR